jgi:hypothetical protein
MRLLQIVFAGLLVAAVAACPLMPAYSYRYRVTVEVDTPQGLRSASSVWGTSDWDNSSPLTTGMHSEERGEAVAVDLPRGTLFALMRGADMRYDLISNVIAGHLAKHPEPGFEMVNDWKANGRLIRDRAPSFDLDPDEYPLLVRFADRQNPATVQKIDPYDLSIFGPGVRLSRIHVAVTTDRAESHIYDRLPWLKARRGALDRTVCEDLAHRPLSCRVTDSDFKTGR